MLHSQFSIFHFPFSKLDLHSYGVIVWRPPHCVASKGDSTLRLPSQPAWNDVGGVECFLLPTSRLLRRASLHGAHGCRRNRHGMTLGALFKTRFAFFQKAC
jgi:hypothetical protein